MTSATDHLQPLLAKLTLEEKVVARPGRRLLDDGAAALDRAARDDPLRRPGGRPRSAVGRARALAQPPSGLRARRLVGCRPRLPVRCGRGIRGPPQGCRRRPRPDHQPAPLAAGRPALRVLQRGPRAQRRTGARRTSAGCRTTASPRRPKHYVANDSETDRFTVDVQLDERALRELYLAPFERAVDAGAWALMSAYNAVDGVTMTENDLLEDPLNSEWGFDGVVISDWTAVRSLDSIPAAQDLAMPGPAPAWARPRRRGARRPRERSGSRPQGAAAAAARRARRRARRVGRRDAERRSTASPSPTRPRSKAPCC